MGPSSSQPHSGFEQKFVSVSCLLLMYYPFSHSFNRPELLEHASKFYGVKFRNKVTFSNFEQAETFGLPWPILCRCLMWTVSPRRRPLTLLTMMPPRVEICEQHHFSTFISRYSISCTNQVLVVEATQSCCALNRDKSFLVMLSFCEYYGCFSTLSIVKPVFVQ